jgi:hypothetical protein
MTRDAVTPGQRALWTFLMAVLAGPFLAALMIFGLSLAAGLFGFGPPSLRNLTVGQLLPLVAKRALDAYAVPAGVAGAACAAWLSLGRVLPWLAGVVAAAVSATTVAVVMGGGARDHVSPIAAIAALAAVGCWLILKRAGIIAAE